VFYHLKYFKNISTPNLMLLTPNLMPFTPNLMPFTPNLMPLAKKTGNFRGLEWCVNI